MTNRASAGGLLTSPWVAPLTSPVCAERLLSRAPTSTSRPAAESTSVVWLTVPSTKEFCGGMSAMARCHASRVLMTRVCRARTSTPRSPVIRVVAPSSETRATTSICTRARENAVATLKKMTLADSALARALPCRLSTRASSTTDVPVTAAPLLTVSRVLPMTRTPRPSFVSSESAPAPTPME